ncbi:hypothetical protein ABEB36_000349 [Hypothenemus hampei]|uniref:Uncharacterized protein n=1 Tax=Hypothenemus hampei TaxID=57062 RepID=A0ABD1FE35_HYPHA
MKQLGNITSGERGFNVTMNGRINAISNHIPPLLVFLTIHFKEYMMVGAPPGSVEAVNSSGFEVTGIYPLNEDVFAEDEFQGAFVTDRPFVDNSIQWPSTSYTMNSSTPANLPEISVSSNSSFVSAEVKRPFPKVSDRKTVRKTRQKGKTRILTWTPEKKEIEQTFAKRKIKSKCRKLPEKITNYYYKLYKLNQSRTEPQKMKI